MYKAKYYKNIESLGHQWQIIIWQDTDNEVTLTEIGPVLQGLRLSVQGEQADIETPIVKTSLTMVFVDAPDLNDPRKCGYWEEFYTSSATEYKVELYKDNVREWTGYITPDSFAEDLQYRGSVSIIARDNLGALQDVQYNAATGSNDMTTLFEIINKAMQVVSFPMQYSFPTGGARGRLHNSELEGFEEDITGVMFNGSAFEGKTWQDVIEGVLLATGMVVRYVGGNSFVVTPMRDISLYDKRYYGDIPIVDVRFSAYGHRELSPAVKTIVDEVQFEIEDNIADCEMPSECYGEQGLCHTYVGYNSAYAGDYREELDVPVFATKGGGWNATSVENSLFLNPFAFPLKEGYSSQRDGDLRAENIVYIVSDLYEDIGEDNEYDRKAVWSTEIGAGKYRFSVPFNRPVGLYDNFTKIGFADTNPFITGFTFRLYCVNRMGRGIAYAEDRGSSGQGMGTFQWVELTDDYEPQRYRTLNSSEEERRVYPRVAEFPEFEISESSKLVLEIYYISNQDLENEPMLSKGIYWGVGPLSLTDVVQEQTSIPKSLKVTTNYNKNNNIRIHRNLEYGFNMGRISSPKTVKNGMYLLNNENWYQASDQWIFDYGDTPQPLSVLLHQQLLAYCSKPNNVLTGELVVGNPLFNALYRWKGKNHIITSGTLNILSGRMENVVLREFVPYAQIWSRTYVLKDMYKVKKDKSTILVSVYGDKEITTDSIGSPYWVAAVKVSRLVEAQLVTFTIEGNDTGAERIAEIEIDTAKIKVVQAAR